MRVCGSRIGRSRAAAGRDSKDGSCIVQREPFCLTMKESSAGKMVFSGSVCHSILSASPNRAALELSESERAVNPDAAEDEKRCR